jgi:hypothetical protein
MIRIRFTAMRAGVRLVGVPGRSVAPIPMITIAIMIIRSGSIRNFSKKVVCFTKVHPPFS